MKLPRTWKPKKPISHKIIKTTAIVVSIIKIKLINLRLLYYTTETKKRLNPDFDFSPHLCDYIARSSPITWRVSMRKVLALLDAFVVSFFCLLILTPLIPFAFAFFDFWTPDSKEAAWHASSVMLILYGISVIGIYSLYKRLRRLIVEKISNFVVKHSTPLSHGPHP